jgi:hypothetical protein
MSVRYRTETRAVHSLAALQQQRVGREQALAGVVVHRSRQMLPPSTLSLIVLSRRIRRRATELSTAQTGRQAARTLVAIARDRTVRTTTHESWNVRNLRHRAATPTGAFVLGERGRRRILGTAKEFCVQRTRRGGPAVGRRRAGAASHSRDRAGESGDCLARGISGSAARHCPRDGVLHLPQAGFHAPSTDDSRGGANDPSDRASRILPRLRDASVSSLAARMMPVSSRAASGNTRTLCSPAHRRRSAASLN